jgi:SHAQKYF class myb-like DNA-binding protein
VKASPRMRMGLYGLSPPRAPPQLGGPHKATAASILKLMRVDGLMRMQVTSHMQKYQQKLAALAPPG